MTANPDAPLAAPTGARGNREGPAPHMTETPRDVLSPREVADRAGFSYHAILRAIRRGDLQAFEPVPGHYRIAFVEYERWLRRPARRNQPPAEPPPRRERKCTTADAAERGSFVRLHAIETST